MVESIPFASSAPTGAFRQRSIAARSLRFGSWRGAVVDPGRVVEAVFTLWSACGSWRSRLLEQDPALVEHEQPAVEQLADLDACTVKGALMRSGWKLQGVTRDRDHVVAPDHAWVAAREHAIEVPRGRTPGRDAVAWLTCEPVAAAL